MMTEATEGLSISWIGGNCPIQAEGTIDGQPFYFRARGSNWSLSVGGEVASDPDWRYEEPYGDGPFAAGWMSEDEARSLIGKAAGFYRSKDPGPFC